LSGVEKTADVCLSVAYIVNIHDAVGAHSYWKQGALGWSWVIIKSHKKYS